MTDTDGDRSAEDWMDGYRAGLRTATDKLKPSSATIRLHAGEMTAQEMRAVRAVLAWLRRSIEGEIDPT